MGSAALPDTWVMRPIREVAKTSAGGTPNSKTAAYYGGEIPWLKIGDLNDGEVTASSQTITQAGYDASAVKWIEPGSVLIAMYGSIGKLGLLRFPATTNQAICAISPDRDILDPEWLFWVLRADRSRLQDIGRGGTQSNISQKDLKDWEIPVPPLEEQRVLVRVIRNAMERVDDVEMQLDLVPELCSQLEASIVQRALAQVDGRTAIEDVATLFTDGDWILKEDLVSGRDVRLIQLGDIGTGVFKNKSDKWISQSRAEDLGVTYLQPGDLLISRMAEPLARGCLLPDLEVPAITAVDVTIARFDERRCLGAYAEIVVNSAEFRASAERVGSGTTRLRITRKKLGALSIPLPPIETQREIIASVTAHRRAIELIKSTMDDTLRELRALRTSILHRTLNGDMPTAVEPEEALS